MDQQYIQRLDKIEAVMQRHLPGKVAKSWMELSFNNFRNAVPYHLTETLVQPGWDLLNRGGKRWRPLLMTLVCEFLGGGDDAVPLTPLVEFPHNASLIHDDIEDSSDERRGKPAVHLIYGTDTAINAGCFLYFLPLRCIDNWDAPGERKYILYQIWSEYLRRLHLGQAMDIAWHRDFHSLPSIDEYIQMCKLKTGVLARMAAVFGTSIACRRTAVSPETESEISQYLGEAVEKLGVGFQILDDVKNLTTGNPGKKRGDDIVEGKKSLPVLLHLHRDDAAGRNEVFRCFNGAREKGISAPEVEELIKMLEQSGSIAEAKQKGLALIAEGEKALQAPSLEKYSRDGQAFKLLSGFVNLLR